MKKAEAYDSVHHDYWVFELHLDGSIMKKEDMTIVNRKPMLAYVKQINQRCRYEDEDVLLHHAISEFCNARKVTVLV